MSRLILTAAFLIATSGADPLHAQARPPAAETSPGTAATISSARPVWPDEGPLTWAPRATESAITANDLRTRLYQFADDSMMGRRMGEAGNYRGTEYIASEFRRLGLKPAGDSGSFFQVLPFGPIGIDSTTASLTVGSRKLAKRTDWIPTVPTIANGVGSSVSVRNAPAVFAGQWGDTSVVLDAAVMRGKVLVFTAAASRQQTIARTPTPALVSCVDLPDRFGADAAIAEEARRRSNSGTTAARPPSVPTIGRDPRPQKVGAAAVLVVDLDEMAQATIRAAFGQPMGMRPAAPLNASAPVSASISRAAAVEIFGRPIEQVSVGTTGQRVSASWNHGWRLSATPARNVIAMLPGSDPALASEYVLVGAHNDHMGVNQSAVDHDSLRAYNMVVRRQGANDPVCKPTPQQQKTIDSLITYARSIRPPRRDSIMNGADDDGSGTVVMLEIAEQFANEKPGRSIIFISHQGEEAGLLGSRWFTDNPTVPLEQIVAAHNMDMVGKGRNWQVRFGGPNSVQMLGARRLSRQFGDIIDSVNANISEPMAIDRSWDVPANPLNRFCRSDQVNYVRKDIPVVYMSLGYAVDYHQLTDEPPYVDYEHSARLGRFVHQVMTAVADRPERPAISGPDPTMPSCGP